MSTSKHNRRPPTIWVSEAPSLQAGTESCITVSETSIVDRTFPKPFRTKETTAALDTEKYRSSSGALHEDPWSILKPIADIKLDHPYVLARYKEDKGRLVQVRKLELQVFSDLGLQRTLNRISHPIFRSLLGCYHHGDSVFLAWEHVEVSVIQILATKLVITASEIIAIVKPILEGIQFLAERGRVLATLIMKTIFFTQSGKVKIVGVEDSYEITTSEMDAAIMKLYALADIVIKLMGKCHSAHEWPVEIENLPDQLKTRSLREILQQRPNLEELKSLVNLTNKSRIIESKLILIVYENIIFQFDSFNLSIIRQNF